MFGAIFPVCDCGIEIVRRLLKKGVPLSCAVTYMLASPIVNPLVIFSTVVAFQGQAPLFERRIANRFWLLHRNDHRFDRQFAAV